MGDAHICLHDTAELRRDGTTIHSDVEISYVDAILGCTTKVKTVDGSVDLKIPSGTQPGTTLVMAKRGVPRLGSSSVRGDHQVGSAEMQAEERYVTLQRVKSLC